MSAVGPGSTSRVCCPVDAVDISTVASADASAPRRTPSSHQPPSSAGPRTLAVSPSRPAASVRSSAAQLWRVHAHLHDAVPAVRVEVSFREPLAERHADLGNHAETGQGALELVGPGRSTEFAGQGDDDRHAGCRTATSSVSSRAAAASSAAASAPTSRRCGSWPGRAPAPWRPRGSLRCSSRLRENGHEVAGHLAGAAQRAGDLRPGARGARTVAMSISRTLQPAGRPSPSARAGSRSVGRGCRARAGRRDGRPASVRGRARRSRSSDAARSRAGSVPARACHGQTPRPTGRRRPTAIVAPSVDARPSAASGSSARSIESSPSTTATYSDDAASDAGMDGCAVAGPVLVDHGGAQPPGHVGGAVDGAVVDDDGGSRRARRPSTSGSAAASSRHGMTTSQTTCTLHGLDGMDGGPSGDHAETGDETRDVAAPSPVPRQRATTVTACRCGDRRAAASCRRMGAALVVAAMLVPLWWDRDVRVDWPPLHADWGPRFDPAWLATVAIGLGLWIALPIVAARLSWFATVVLSTAASWVWAMALALSDGRLGTVARVLRAARGVPVRRARVDDIGMAVADVHRPHRVRPSRALAGSTSPGTRPGR